MLPDLIRRGRQPSVGITVHAATITLRITAEGRSAEECAVLMEPTAVTIREHLGALVFGEEEDELEDAVMRLLKEQGKTLATVECGTAGTLTQWLSRAAAGSPSYVGGQVIIGDAMLRRTLGTRGALFDQFGPASREVCEALAQECLTQSGADYALAIGPFSSEATKNPDVPFYFALATPEGVTLKASSLAGHPTIWVPRAAKMALNLLRLTLAGVL